MPAFSTCPPLPFCERERHSFDYLYVNVFFPVQYFCNVAPVVDSVCLFVCPIYKSFLLSSSITVIFFFCWALFVYSPLLSSFFIIRVSLFVPVESILLLLLGFTFSLELFYASSSCVFNTKSISLCHCLPLLCFTFSLCRKFCILDCP